MPQKYPTISIVIPCYNEQLYVGALLDDIALQKKHIHQIIVADSGSTDETLAVIKAHQLGRQVHITHDSYKTPGGARNSGAKAATGDYIVFIDADTRLPSDIIRKLRLQLANNPVTYITPLFTTDGYHIVDHTIIWFINLLLYARFGQKNCVPGTGMMMCVQNLAHQAIGGFDNHLVKENDMEYLERLRHYQSVSYSVLTRPLVTTSSRRYRKQGRVIGLLYMTPRNSLLGKRIVYPLLDRLGHSKKYGIFNS